MDLPQSETLYSKLVHSLGGIVWEADGETFQFTYVSPQAEQILGYPVAQWLNQPDFWRTHTHPDDTEWCAAFCLDSTRHGKDHEFEYRMIAADGRVIWLHDIVSVKIEPSGSVCLRGIMLDITERKQAEDDLRKQKEILQKIFENIPVMVSFYDANGRLMLVNREWERMRGWSLKEIQEQNLDIMAEVYPDPVYRRKVLDFIQAAKGEWVDFKSTARDGRVIDSTWAVVRLSDGTTVSIGKDITERRRSEEDRNQLLRRLITAQEDERRHISRELHDNMGQYLAALLLGLESVRTVSGLPPRAQKELLYLKNVTKQFEQEVHRFALELRPSSLDDLGLEAALSNLVADFAKRHQNTICVDFHCSGFAEYSERLLPDIEVAIYRSVQEALTNVLRHARAQHLSVILERYPDNVRVIIEDDGKGFDAETLMSVQNERLGLRGMRERLELVGGEFKIDSGAGTTIVVNVPL